MAHPTLTFHGASRTVTGSCFEVTLAHERLLVDCGIFQGPRTLEALNREPFAFRPDTIRALVLTHAHIDHSGLVPRLVREGFRGSIWCTAGTADLLRHMLPDAGRIQEYEAERRNRRPDRRGEEEFEPLYTEADALAACEQLQPVRYGEWFGAAEGMDARLWNAGHILGSASVELKAGATTILFSGDLGPDNKSFHEAPEGPTNVDHLLCESTYGNRDREDVTPEARRERLRTEVVEAIARGGNLVIPTFALERTQELLLDMARLMNAAKLPRVQVFIDSPLASRVTGVFAQHARELEDLDGTDVFRHPAFHFVESPEQSMRLNDMTGAVIMAASGMCEAGRIRHHLVHNLPSRNSTILFVGYQAGGTLGRQILEGAGRVRISGREVNVRAEIRRIDSYSAHADRGELIAWARARLPKAGTTFLTHGEDAALASLQGALGEGARIPEIGETFELLPGAQARRLHTGRHDIASALTRDWQNEYADFAVSLKSRLSAIEGEKERHKALNRMRRVLDDMEKHRSGRASVRTN